MTLPRLFPKQVVIATLTSGLIPALGPPNHNDDDEADAVGALAAQLAHAGEVRTTAAGLPMDLRTTCLGTRYWWRRSRSLREWILGGF